MDKGKRKYLVEPVQQEGVSKYGRKVSKFVFKLSNKSYSCDVNKESINVESKNHISEEIKISSKQINCTPSIVLCKSNTSIDDIVVEQEFNITSFSTIKVHSPRKIDNNFEPKLFPKVKRKNIEKIINNEDTSVKINEKVTSEISPLIQIKVEAKGDTSQNYRKNEKKKGHRKENNTKLDKDIKQTKVFKLKNNSSIASKLKINLSGDIGTKPNIENQNHHKPHEYSRKKQLSSSKPRQEMRSKDDESLNKSPKVSVMTSPRNKNHLVTTDRTEEDIDKIIQEKIKTEEIRLKKDNESLLSKLNELKKKAEKMSELESYQKERLTLNKLKQNQEMLYYYIGFKDMSLIDVMIERLTEYFSDKEKFCEEVLIEDQLTMTLMKLRRNYSMHDLAFRFRVSISEAYCIVFNIILGLHHLYYENESLLKPFPMVSSMQNNLPEQFINFPNCRVVLECVRIGCEDPDNELESDIFTSTKFDPKVYLKGLIGISPTKQVLYASNLYECATRNADIFRDCGILDKLTQGDLIMADKSFDDIIDYLPRTIDLNVPSSFNSTLSDKQIKNLNSKARALIGRTTMQHIRRFSILFHIPIFLNSIAVKVFQLCSVLVNLQPTINIQSDSNLLE